MTTLRARILDTPSAGEVRWLDDARVVWSEGVITEVAPWSGGSCDADVREGHVLTAGCVDGHVHAAQARVVGRASGPLLSWLSTTVFPEEARFADPRFARAVADGFWRDVLASGTTTALAYGSVHAEASEQILQSADAAGVRAIVGPVWMDEASPAALHVPAEAQAEAVEALAARWSGHDRLEVAVVPRFAVSCSPRMLRVAAETASRLGLRVTTHLAETPEEGVAACSRHGASRYVQVYEDAGLLRLGTVLAHCIHMDGVDWDVLERTGCVVAHCPDSNDFLGSGGMPLGVVRERGLPMVLGTDVAAGRSLKVPRTASHGFDNALRQGLRVDPGWWWWAATAGGAQALGAGDRGRVAIGQLADVVLHRVPETVASADDALAAILFDPDHSRPVRTWVDGKEAWCER